MKNIAKKFFSVCIAIFTLFNILTVSAENGIVCEEYSADTVGIGDVSLYVDEEKFREYLAPKLYACEEEIDISQFNFPLTNEALSAICDFVIHGMPENFHVNRSFGGSGAGGIMYYLSVTYDYKGEELEKKRAEFEGVISEMLSEIQSNEALSDVEKALLLHDRLALRCEYDYTYSHRTAYDALVLGTSVCEGYAKAYGVLLDRVGIENEYCSSDDLNHGWNIVYIGGKPYHVDVTWDDPSWDMGDMGVLGLVAHDNFLRSTAGLIESGHEADDFNSTPKDTVYDNYFWKNSQTAFVLLGGEIYYIDNASSSIKKYGSNEVLLTISDIWKASGSTYWVGNFARLSTDGKYLYYSLSNAVYRFDVKTKENKKIFEPSLSGYTSIYGMEYADGYIVCDVNNAPPYGGGTTLNRISVLAPSERETEIAVSPNAPISKENGYLVGVSDGTTVTELLSMLENKDAVVCDKNGTILESTEFCATGDIVKLAYGDNVIDDVVIVISGDVDGNGTVDATDYVRIKSVFLGKLSMNGEYFLAADVEEDGVLDTTDFLRIKSIFLGLYN